MDAARRAVLLDDSAAALRMVRAELDAVIDESAVPSVRSFTAEPSISRATAPAGTRVA